MRTDAGGHRRRRHPGRLRDARRRLRRGRRRRRLDAAAARRAPLERRARGYRVSSAVYLYALPIVFVLAGLALYAVLARRRLRRRLLGAARRPRRAGDEIRDHAHHSMAPGLGGQPCLADLRADGLWTAYPVAFGSIASTLAVPLFIAGIGIVLRGGAYALRAGAARRASTSGSRRLRRLVDPHAVRARHDGRRDRRRRVPVGNAAGAHFTSWLGPHPSRSACSRSRAAAYMAAVFLAPTPRAAASASSPALPPACAGRRLAGRGGRLAGLVALHTTPTASTTAVHGARCPRCSSRSPRASRRSRSSTGAGTSPLATRRRSPSPR